MSCNVCTVHADYCRPFLGNCYALVLEDAFSKYPEVFFTTKADADFTKRALRKVFAREGVPQALVTDNGTQFTGEILQSWLPIIGCRSVFNGSSLCGLQWTGGKIREDAEDGNHDCRSLLERRVGAGGRQFLSAIPQCSAPRNRQVSSFPI